MSAWRTLNCVEDSRWQILAVLGGAQAEVLLEAGFDSAEVEELTKIGAVG
jgi:hypothetical protein